MKSVCVLVQSVWGVALEVKYEDPDQFAVRHLKLPLVVISLPKAVFMTRTVGVR